MTTNDRKIIDVLNQIVSGATTSATGYALLAKIWRKGSTADREIVGLLNQLASK